MRIIDANKNEIEIANSHWPLADDLFYRWDMFPNVNNEIKVNSVYDIAPELSAWGIPWRYL
jgi:hypothetical protein